MKTRSCKVLPLAVLGSLFALGIIPERASAQATVVTLGATLVGLQQLKSQLESTVNTVDAEAAARINQLSIAVDSAIKEVQQAIRDTSNQVQYDENKVFTDVFTVISNVNSELDSKGYLAYIGVNASLANLATIMDGIPLVNIKSFLFATYPLRLKSDATDTLVSIYGHFPDVDGSHPATLTYTTTGLPAQTVTLKKFVGGSLGFPMARSYLKQGQFVDMTIQIPAKWMYVFTKSETFSTRVYIEVKNAFSMKIDTFQENPKLWATIVAPAEYTERADSDRTSNNGSASAQQLFSVLVNDNATYDASTATFAAVGSRVDATGSPCWCNCSGASGHLNSWDANSVSWSLNAPSCGVQVCTKGGGGFLGLPQIQQCGGGGTHAEIHLLPTFRVKVRNQAAGTLLSSDTVAAGRDEVVSRPLELTL